MFEGLVPTLQESADQLHSRFERIEHLLAGMVEGLTASVERDTWIRKSITVKKEASDTIRNDTGYGWLVRYISSTVKTEVFLDSETDVGFLRAMAKGEGDNVHWYIPPGSILIVSSEEGGTVSIHAEQFATPAVSRAHSGRSGEHIASPVRVEPIPSGHPLNGNGE